jgi:non-heme chloroperoxidase
VSYGLKISRLSKDLYEFLTELDLNDVTLLVHSMGSAVIWCYMDLFGPEHLSKIILVDQSPFLIADPHWTQQEVEESGAVDTPQKVFDTIAALRSREVEQLTRQIIDGTLTRHATSEVREWMVRCNLKMPRPLPELYCTISAIRTGEMSSRGLTSLIPSPKLFIAGARGPLQSPPQQPPQR